MGTCESGTCKTGTCMNDPDKLASLDPDQLAALFIGSGEQRSTPMEIVSSVLVDQVPIDTRSGSPKAQAVQLCRPLLTEEMDEDLPLTDPEELRDAVLEVTLSKVDPGQRLGFRTIPCRGSHYVAHIYKPSLLSDYNTQHPGAEVQIGDHIVDINGVRGDSEKISTKWTTQSILCMKIIAATVLELVVTKKANEMLGIKTRCGSKVHQITSIEEGGAIALWNASRNQQRCQPVQVGDYIVEVNGVQGDAELVRQEWISRGFHDSPDGTQTREKLNIKVMAPRHRPLASNADSSGTVCEEEDG
jgi:hypothetical protein